MWISLQNWTASLVRVGDLAGVRERVDERLHEDVAAPVGQRQAALHALFQQETLHEDGSGAENGPKFESVS